MKKITDFIIATNYGDIFLKISCMVFYKLTGEFDHIDIVSVEHGESDLLKIDGFISEKFIEELESKALDFYNKIQEGK